MLTPFEGLAFISLSGFQCLFWGFALLVYTHYQTMYIYAFSYIFTVIQIGLLTLTSKMLSSYKQRNNKYPIAFHLSSLLHVACMGVNAGYGNENGLYCILALSLWCTFLLCLYIQLINCPEFAIIRDNKALLHHLCEQNPAFIVRERLMFAAQKGKKGSMNYFHERGLRITQDMFMTCVEHRYWDCMTFCAEVGEGWPATEKISTMLKEEDWNVLVLRDDVISFLVKYIKRVNEKGDASEDTVEMLRKIGEIRQMRVEIVVDALENVPKDVVVHIVERYMF